MSKLPELDREAYSHLPSDLTVALSEVEERFRNDPESLWIRFWETVFYMGTPLLWKMAMYPQDYHLRAARVANMDKVIWVIRVYRERFNTLYDMPLEGPVNLEDFLAMSPTRNRHLN